MTEISEEVVRQCVSVQRTGATNMVYERGVRDTAQQLGHGELVEFIDDRDTDYSELLHNYDSLTEKYGIEV